MEPALKSWNEWKARSSEICAFSFTALFVGLGFKDYSFRKINEFLGRKC